MSLRPYALLIVPSSIVRINKLPQTSRQTHRPTVKSVLSAADGALGWWEGTLAPFSAVPFTPRALICTSYHVFVLIL